MQLQTKALYNLLQLYAKEGGIKDFQPWQVENLRPLSDEELFSRLRKLGVEIDKERFSLFAEESDTPEELSDVLMDEKEKKESRDQAYLLSFELWRRFFPQRQSLSIFCDELDFRIENYLQGNLANDEPIQDVLANLEEILDGNVDSGAEPDFVFQTLLQYCAHDIEAFLYEYIAEQVNVENELYASELIDGFYPYLSNLKWFDFLRVRLISKKEIAEANEIIEHIYKEVAQAADYTLQWELIKFLVQDGDIELFKRFVLLTLPLVENEKKFQNLLQLISDFYERLDEEQKEKVILEHLRKRKEMDLKKKLSSSDPDYIWLQNFLKAN